MRRFAALLLACAVLFAACATPALADIGPKPAVYVEFANAEGLEFYATLLSSTPSTGPASAWDGTEGDVRIYSDEPEAREAWEAFAHYEDADGFYFLQEFWDCSGGERLEWIYYPPETFKLLLYFPQSGSFRLSPVYSRYAFDSYYTADLGSSDSGTLSAVRSYDYTWELISLCARLLLTLAVELALAAAMGYGGRAAFRLIFVVNAITQTALNLALNAVAYFSGSWNFVFAYVLLELAVTALEAALYVRLLPQRSGGKGGKGRAALYSVAANALSFALGLVLARVIPGIF